MPAVIDEIRALLTITTPIVSSWQKGGDSSIPTGAYGVCQEKPGYDYTKTHKPKVGMLPDWISRVG